VEFIAYTRVIIARARIPVTIRNNSNINSTQKLVRRMMKRSLKLPKKIKPEWRARNFSPGGPPRGPAGGGAPSPPPPPHPSPLVKGDSCRRKNPRTIIGSRDRMRVAEKHPYRSVAPKLSSTLSSTISLARTPFVRSFALAPFRWGRAIAHARSPTITTWTTLRRRCRRPSSFVRPTDRPRSVARA